MKHVYAVILAGGSGTRFWPKSRQALPKQLCKMGSDPRTMIEITLARLDNFIPPERRIIITHEKQANSTREIVGHQVHKIIAEPQAKNTANALCLAALEINSLYAGDKSPIMISLHADHLIKDEEQFRDSLLKAIFLAEQDYLTLVGIVPDRPETGFGYIQMGAKISEDNKIFGYRVKSFREKPAQTIAEEYVASKNFLWNSGLFIWKTKVFLAEMEKRLPNNLALLTELYANSLNQTQFEKMIPTIYSKLMSISVDHGILELSDQVAVVSGGFYWQDIGSWDALATCFPKNTQGNVIFGEGLAIDSNNCVIDSDGPFIAVLGVNDLVIAHSHGAILVCPKERSQDVKKIVEALESRGRKDLL